MTWTTENLHKNIDTDHAVKVDHIPFRLLLLLLLLMEKVSIKQTIKNDLKV